MSDVISTGAYHPEIETLTNSHEPSPSLSNPDDRFDRLAHQPQYRHFVRIPGRIIQCLDYFDVLVDRAHAAETLLAYYLFIGVVDQAIDSGEPMTAKIVFDRLARQADHYSDTSDVDVVTERLRSRVDRTMHPLLLDKLRNLYDTVLEERVADSIEAYVESRKHLGRLTAELSYLLIRPALQGEQVNLREFMEQVGAIGCLVDSVIDLRVDRRRGLLNFELTLSSQFRLFLSTVAEGLTVAVAHPKLAGLFFQAILDDVRDHFTRLDQAAPLLTKRISSEVAGVG